MAVDARKERGGGRQLIKSQGFSFIVKTMGKASERLNLSRVVAQSDTHLRKTVPATEWRLDGRI